MDTINSNLLDNDLINNYSNASGCGLPPVCTEKKLVKGSRRSCKTVLGKQVCVNTPTVKTVVNQSCIDSKARYKACLNDPNRKKLIQKVKETVKKTTTDIKKKTTKAQQNIKKRVVRLREKVGVSGKNFRNKFRGIVRKGILFNIKNNIHGTAMRLYPAVASDSNVAKRKYKKGFVNKSRALYNSVVKQWVNLGGNEFDLKNAIISGSTKKFLKSPYKSFNGDDSYSLYAYYTPSNITNLTTPNIEFYGVEGDEFLTEEGVYNEQTGEEEFVSQEEEVKGIRAFFAWLRGLFNRNKADENPYAEGTEEYSEYEQEANSDSGNEPDPSEANDPDYQDVLNKGDEDGAGTSDDESAGDENEDGILDDDKILGMPKGLAIGLGIAVLAIGGFIVYKKFIAKK